MVSLRHTNSRYRTQKNFPKRTLSIFKNSFASPSILRKHPFLASLHRGVDGALVGVIVFGTVMTSLALHSQHLWTQNFSRLQLTRDLNNRLEVSTAILERYFIKTSSSSRGMVVTKSSDLLYVDRPQRRQTFVQDFLLSVREHFTPAFYPINNGY